MTFWCHLVVNFCLTFPAMNATLLVFVNDGFVSISQYVTLYSFIRSERSLMVKYNIEPLLKSFRILIMVLTY